MATNIKDYSTTQASNTSLNTINVGEGMLPSNLNNAIRALMKNTRDWFNDAQWIEYGDGSGSYTATYVSGTAFTIDGSDVTAIYHANRRVQVVDSAATLYGTISSTSFSTNTTVNVTWDSGSLTSGAITSVYIGVLAKTNSSIPIEVVGTTNIADDAVTAAKTAPSAEEESGLGLNSAATGNLTGTISTQQLQLADAFTLTGDLTVNDDLILGKVRDDGTGQSLTGSGKTLTGTGTLTMGSSIVRDDRDISANGMSGTLGSGVTGSPALNLGASTFPAGHVVQTTVPNRGVSTSTGSSGASVITGSITPVYDNSSIIIFASWQADYTGETTGDAGYNVKWQKTGTGVTTAVGDPVLGPMHSSMYMYFYRSQESASTARTARYTNAHQHVLMDNDCETTNEITYTLHWATYNVDGTFTIGGNSWGYHNWSVHFQEIKR